MTSSNKRRISSWRDLSSELKRRRVYPVVAAYAVFAFVVLQVAEITFEPVARRQRIVDSWPADVDDRRARAYALAPTTGAFLDGELGPDPIDLNGNGSLAPDEPLIDGTGHIATLRMNELFVISNHHKLLDEIVGTYYGGEQEAARLAGRAQQRPRRLRPGIG